MEEKRFMRKEKNQENVNNKGKTKNLKSDKRMKKKDINKNFAFLREKSVFFFDLDGTLYLEDILFEGVFPSYFKWILL